MQGIWVYPLDIWAYVPFNQKITHIIITSKYLFIFKVNNLYLLLCVLAGANDNRRILENQCDRRL